VVGYGTQKKSDVTGSVTSISKDRLSKIPVTNVLQAVQGAAAGVNITQTSSIPGEEPSVLIRGKNSINAATGPYVVVDGIPISKSGGSLNDVNPSDIASIEILKDASAVAIYGTNGANGVILVTTKRGNSYKPVIRYDGYVGVEDIAHIPAMCPPEELIARYKEGKRINGSPMIHEEVKYENEVENYKNGRLTDWIDAVTQTGIITDNNISISGGATNVKYYVSGNFMDQKGVVKGYNYKRYSFRTNLDINVTDYLTVGTNSYIVAHNKDGGRAHLLNAAAMSPYAKMYNDDGSLCIYPMYGETLWSNPLLNTTTNPERRQFNVNVNAYAEVNFGRIWKPLAGLKYKLNAGYSYVPRRESSYTGASVNDLNGTARINNYETQNSTIENIVTYARDIDKHHFDLTGLYAAQQKKYLENTAQAVGFVNDELEWNNMAAGATAQVGSKAERYATLSQMGRLNYSYDSRYLFTFTVRRDGSSVFGVNNKYGTFPSVALGWNIHNESFMEKATALNSLKLRLSYGKSGNEAINVYQAITTMASRQIAMGGATHIAMITDKLGNLDLTWETTSGFNAGLDFGLWNSRVNGTIDVYSSTTQDLLLQRQLPTVSGFNSVFANMGKTANKGVEITLQTRNIVEKDFQWASGIVFAWNKNEIKELYGDGKDDIGNRWFIGQPIGVIYDYVKVGIWQEDEIERGDHLQWDPIAKPGDVKLANLDGKAGITDDDRKVLGQTTPKWTGGLTNTFTYKDLSLNIFIQTVQGAMRNNYSVGINADELERRNSFAEIGFWTPENKSNEWRSLNKNSNPHEYGFPYKANYTRIKDVTLSYSLPKSLIRKMSMEGLSVYVSGRNLYTFTNWIGWDPEESDAMRGWDSSDINYPSVKSIVFGINLTL
jgi:TonB-linked SusC/RagA family outer membrane protein